jgi:predicted dehydrogenase
MVSLALVGTAHIHTPKFADRLAQNPRVKVAAVWDSDLARARPYAERFGARLVSDPATLWDDPSFSAAIVCSETDMHPGLVRAAAGAGKHLFVEKPLGLGAADAGAMVRAVRDAGVLFQTGFFRRGQSAYLTLKSLVEKGAFGQVTRVREANMHEGSLGGWFDKEWRWMADPKRAGVGAFGDLGAHSLDILLWLFGKVERVTALVNPVTGRYGDCDETGEALLRFANGANATLGAGWLDHGNPITCEVSGTKAYAYILDGQLHLKCPDLTGEKGFRPYSEAEGNRPHPLDQFLAAVDGEPGHALIPVEEAAYGCAVMEAIYRSAAENRWVEPASLS